MASFVPTATGGSRQTATLHSPALASSMASRASLAVRSSAASGVHSPQSDRTHRARPCSSEEG